MIPDISTYARLLIKPHQWFGAGAWLITFYAMLIIEQTTLSARPVRVRLYATHTAPQIAGIITAFALPLFVRHSTELKPESTGVLQEIFSLFSGKFSTVGALQTSMWFAASIPLISCWMKGVLISGPLVSSRDTILWTSTIIVALYCSLIYTFGMFVFFALGIESAYARMFLLIFLVVTLNWFFVGKYVTISNRYRKNNLFALLIIS